ncbi:hypothetical protein [Streptomyces sp. NPDC003832]
MPEKITKVGDSRLPKRYWSKVSVQPNGCWQWTGAPDKDGYGEFWRNGRHHRAHRVSYEALVGAIPAGLEMDHLCHTRDVSCDGTHCKHRGCVNPSHLEPVSRAENNRRNRSVATINAGKTHCPSGHEYNAVNTYTWGKNRYCRPCNRANVAKYKARKLAERSGVAK